jgi:hypothetical protein
LSVNFLHANDDDVWLMWLTKIHFSKYRNILFNKINIYIISCWYISCRFSTVINCKIFTIFMCIIFAH